MVELEVLVLVVVLELHNKLEGIMIAAQIVTGVSVALLVI